MKYLSFSLENYKGIKNFEIKINADKPISLIGLNESGKTTILEGICNIGKHCQCLASQKNSALLSNGELQKIKPKKGLFSNDIKLSCKIKKNSKVFKISFVYTFEKDRPINYNVFYNDKRIDFKDGDVFEKVEKFSENIPDIIYYSDFILDIPDEIKFHTTAYKKGLSIELLEKVEKKDEKNEKNVSWQAVLQDITNSFYRDAKNSVLFKKDIVDYLDGDNSGGELAFKDTLAGFSQHINNTITKKWLSCLTQPVSLEEVNLVSKEDKVVGERNFSFEVKATNKSIFPLSGRSKGCKWFFAFMLFTEFRKYRKSNSIFLLDEPASNLHCSIQEQVIKSMNDLCDKDDTGSSVIYSTHAPYLLDIQNLETMYLVKNNTTDEVSDPDITISLLLDKRKKSREDLDEKRPVFDYFKLNTEIIKKYLKKKNTDVNSKVKDFSQKFLSGIKNIKTIEGVIDLLKDLF